MNLLAKLITQDVTYPVQALYGVRIPTVFDAVKVIMLPFLLILSLIVGIVIYFRKKKK